MSHCDSCGKKFASSLLSNELVQGKYARLCPHCTHYFLRNGYTPRRIQKYKNHSNNNSRKVLLPTIIFILAVVLLTNGNNFSDKILRNNDTPMTYAVNYNNNFNEVSSLLSSVVRPYYSAFDDMRNHIINFQSNPQAINNVEYQALVTKLNEVEVELHNFENEFSELNALIRLQFNRMKDILILLHPENVTSNTTQSLNNLIISLNSTQKEMQTLIIDYIEERDLRYEVLDNGQINIYSD